MTNYSQYVGKNRNTHVTEKLNPSQVVNNTGGYVFQVDKWTHLDRFLILGAEGGTYYAGEKKHFMQNYSNLLECVAEDGTKVVDRIVEISDAGRAPKNDPAIFALAFVLKNGDVDARRHAAAMVNKVCRTGTHLFQLAENVKAFGGWGKVTTRAFQNWYLEKSDDNLAYQLMKYQQRDGWSQRDILRKAHPVAQNEVQNALFNWATKGWEGIGNEPHPQKPLDRIWAFEKAKVTTSANELVKLITDYNLPQECIPTQFKTDVKVQEALLEKMPMTALIRNLGNYTRSGLLTSTSKATKLVVERLNDDEYIRKSRIHPINILNALKTYASGQGFRGDKAWVKVGKIVDALDAAFYKAFANVEPTGKNILLGLDVSGSMFGNMIAGMNLDAITVEIAMAMITLATEENVEVVAFSAPGGFSNRFAYNYNSNGLTVVSDLSPRRRLDDNIKTIREKYSRSMTATNLALPMTWAMEQGRKEFDAIVIYTDNEVNSGSHPAEALRKYRQFSGRNTRFIIAGLTATRFTIADPNDAGMFDVVGCDSATPQLISEFIAGNL